VTRKDFQIKRHGYRIELGEIEAAISSQSEVDAVGVIYDEKNDLIIAFYEGKVEDKVLFEWAKTKLQSYMLPDRIEKIPRMPYNANGKIDRKKLKEF
jgi:amino acid adenylation domain protein